MDEKLPTSKRLRRYAAHLYVHGMKKNLEDFADEVEELEEKLNLVVEGITNHKGQLVVPFGYLRVITEHEMELIHSIFEGENHGLNQSHIPDLPQADSRG